MYLLCLGKSDSPVWGTDQSQTKPPFPNASSNVSQILPGGSLQGYCSGGKLIIVLAEPSKSAELTWQVDSDGKKKLCIMAITVNRTSYWSTLGSRKI